NYGIPAQLNPFAPSSAMDTMNEGSVSGGLPSRTYIDRAREVGIAPKAPTAATPAPRPPGGEVLLMDEMGPRGSMRPGMPIAPGQPLAPGAPTPSPTPKMIRVLTGSRVECAVYGILLEDIIYKDVPESEKGNYYDDGAHGGDQEAGDGTYTNITVRKDVMSPEAHLILRRTLTLLKNVEQMEPMDFYRMNVVTSEPLSSLPKQIDEEQDRDDMKLDEWNKKFLRDFRISSDDPKSAFYPLYVPPPPSYPNVPLPEGFKPVALATPTPGGPGTMGMEIMGEPGMMGEGPPTGGYYRTRGNRGVSSGRGEGF
ncbi:MAG: hypothetical protein NT106_12100, partial [Candidatus Sumerlaeota bacterium]|nr:hypothetical protein [Candidatus Sumerlaeota bacterium]